MLYKPNINYRVMGSKYPRLLAEYLVIPSLIFGLSNSLQAKKTKTLYLEVKTINKILLYVILGEKLNFKFDSLPKKISHEREAHPYILKLIICLGPARANTILILAFIMIYVLGPLLFICKRIINYLGVISVWQQYVLSFVTS